MTIQVGDTFPAVTLKWLTDSGLEEVDTGEYFKGRKVVLFAVPGAFTPACSKEHLPGYVARADEIRAKGVDEIVCLAVNDPFVMQIWGEQLGATGKVTMLPDGNGSLTQALGLAVDISAAGLGTRCQRCAMVLEDGVVKTLEVEPGKGVTVSGAGQCLVNLGAAS